MAHEALQEHVGAVVQMRGEHDGRVEAPFLAPVVVVVCGEALAQGVEAVDLVEDFDFDHVVRIQAPVFGRHDGVVGVFAELDDVVVGDRVDADVRDAIPGGVDFWGGRETVDVGCVGGRGKHGCVSQSVVEWEVETTEDGGVE